MIQLHLISYFSRNSSNLTCSAILMNLSNMSDSNYPCSYFLSLQYSKMLKMYSPATENKLSFFLSAARSENITTSTQLMCEVLVESDKKSLVEQVMSVVFLEEQPVKKFNRNLSLFFLNLEIYIILYSISHRLLTKSEQRFLFRNERKSEQKRARHFSLRKTRCVNLDRQHTLG